MGAISLCVLAHLATGDPGYGHGLRLGHAFHGHGHGYLVSPCKHTVEEVEKEICRYEPEKKCETKTQTYKVITGYEKGECKEIDVCKHPLHHKREASAHGYGYVACVKEKKDICKSKPTIEEKSKDRELCHLEPKKVCKMITVKVPKLDCKEEEEAEEATDYFPVLMNSLKYWDHGCNHQYGDKLPSLCH